MNCRKILVPLAIGCMALSLGCASLKALIPKDMYYDIAMTPVLSEGGGAYQVDPDDPNRVSFSHEGMRIEVRPYTDAELNDLFPPLMDGRHVNPYTTDVLDVELGYVPPVFTVFDVKVINETYAKIEFNPANTLLTTNTGRELRYYDPGRAGEGVEAGRGNRFSAYYQTERGRSGLDKDTNLERMGLIYKSAFHRFRPVFRGDERSGTLSFANLPTDATSVVLEINDFALRFDASGNPEHTIDFQFEFDVVQGVVTSGVDPID